MEVFLRRVERRAFRMAELAVGNPDDALDIVQEAMLAFVGRYRGRPAQEREPLFWRVLRNKITDWRRRNAVRNRFRVWLGRGDEQGQADPVEQLSDPAGDGPAELDARDRTARLLEQALRELPLRQQQAFLLRAWEGLDVAETARAMGCSEGSVKTHYFRALKALRARLEGEG